MLNSRFEFLRNSLRRTGIVENKSATVTVVPIERAWEKMTMFLASKALEECLMPDMNGPRAVQCLTKN